MFAKMVNCFGTQAKLNTNSTGGNFKFFLDTKFSNRNHFHFSAPSNFNIKADFPVNNSNNVNNNNNANTFKVNHDEDVNNVKKKKRAKLMRMDDNGNIFVMNSNLSWENAEFEANRFQNLDHHQTYWAEPLPDQFK